MFKGVSKKLAVAAVRKNAADSKNIEEYIYGLNLFFTLSINVISALIIGLLMNMTFEIVLYIFVYKFLRKYIGGSHAKTAARCYVSSCLTYVVALTIIKYYPFSSLPTIVLSYISAFILWIICPVEAEKKPLDDIERKVFRHRGHIRILICICGFMVLVYYSRTYYFSIVVVISMLTVTLFSIEGMLRLWLKRMY